MRLQTGISVKTSNVIAYSHVYRQCLFLVETIGICAGSAEEMHAGGGDYDLCLSEK